jgi:ABC-type branched-subunit amino acid transport system ATPase component/ABC-type branched-subunit amino acid transport system permease subunit
MTRPPRLRAHPLAVLALLLLVLPFALPAIGLTVGLATEIAIYALYGIAYNLLLGYTGLVSFGPSAYFGTASYVAGLAEIHLVHSVYPSILLGTAWATLTGAVLGALILRRRGVYFALLTLAFTQLFFEIAFRWTDVTGGENGLQGVTRPGFGTPLAFYAFCAAVVLGAVYLLWRIVHSPFGRVLQAIRDNEQRATCLGYDTRRYKLVAFVLSSAFMGLAGSLLTFLIQGVYADNLNWQHAGDPVIMTVLGGMHHFLGPLWGAVVYITLSDLLSSYTEHWWLVFGALLILFVLLSPEGLSGIYARIRRGARWSLTRAELPPRPAVAAQAVAAPTRTGDRAPVLSVRGLCKRFGALVVADGITLDLRRGELHSMIGPNGAGKTTFFNMLTGLVEPDAGQILLGGRDVTALPVHLRVAAGLARSFQIISIFKDLSVFENVRIAVQASSPHRFSLWRDAYALPDVIGRTWALLDTVGLAERAGETAVNLSHGEQRLLEIALTLAGDPEVLLLDEPLAGLADAERERISAVIRRLGGAHTVLLIEHDIDRVISLSDRITVLHQGRVIASGTPQEVVGNPEVVTAYLGRREEAGVALAARPLSPTPAGGARALLQLEGVTAGYNGSRVLHDLALRVDEGEVVALLGRNGVGKTTTLRTVVGTVRPVAGRVAYRGTDITRWSPDRIARLGISVVPEGRRIFPNLTVLENLRLAQRPGGWRLEEVFDLFPRLRELLAARGESLSGGERQMLAIARALMAPTDLLLLDEPLEGLAPSVVAEVLGAIARLRGHTSILLVEQKVPLVLQMADRAYVMVNGRIAYAGGAEELLRNEDLQVRLLSVQAAPAPAALEGET